MAKNPSLTSAGKASKAQVRRVRTLTNEATEAVFENGSFTHDELQAVHANGGEYKAQYAGSFIAFFRAFARKVRGIVTPKRAEDTGLIPANWQVKTDKLEGDVGLTKLDYGCCPVRAGESWVNGDTMLQRAAEVGAIGSLGFAAELLKAQEEGKEIFPVESRGRHYFIMPLTVLLGGSGDRHVAVFLWAGERWMLHWFWLSYSFNSFDRFVRVRESAAA